VEVVGPGPDVEEYERPEVNDRQAVRVYRPLHALRDEVVHDAEEAGGEEEPDRVVAVPPLGHGVLNAGVDDVALRPGQAYRHGRIVDEVQHRDGDDEGEIEPVRDVDVRFLAAGERAEEDQQVDHPDHGQQQVCVPFGFGVLLALGNAEQVAGARDRDEELEAPDYKVG
jgi:23S rRNA (cytosine1962-C5)-methyltransferase